MRRFLLAGLLVFMVGASAYAETYVVWWRQYVRHMGNFDGADSRGRSVTGTISQMCVECLGEAIVLTRPAEADPAGTCGALGMQYVEFNTVAEARAFFQTRCNRCW